MRWKQDMNYIFTFQDVNPAPARTLTVIFIHACIIELR